MTAIQQLDYVEQFLKNQMQWNNKKLNTLEAETCKIELSGFQTYESIFCITALNNDRLVVMFKAIKMAGLLIEPMLWFIKSVTFYFHLIRELSGGRKKPFDILHIGAPIPPLELIEKMSKTILKKQNNKRNLN